MIHTATLTEACREMARRMGHTIEGDYFKSFPNSITLRHLDYLATGNGAFEILRWLLQRGLSAEEESRLYLRLPLSVRGLLEATPKGILEIMLTATDEEGREWRIEG